MTCPASFGCPSKSFSDAGLVRWLVVIAVVSSIVLTTIPVQCRRYWLWRHSPPSSYRQADVWPFPPRCNQPLCRCRRCSATGPAGRTGRKSGFLLRHGSHRRVLSLHPCAFLLLGGT